MSAIRIEARLRELMRAGALAKSACSSEMLSFIAPLRDAGVLAWERRGAGEVLAVCDDATLYDFIARQFPMLASELPANVSLRVAGVARFRDSKALPCDTPDILTVRAWSDTILWKDSQAIPAGEATRSYGVFSFVPVPGERYEIRGPCALVEGPELLLGFDRISAREECTLVIYGGGRISRQVLDWLATQSAPNFQLLHCPDYDPVGLNEYLRLRGALGTRVRLHVPSDLEESFARFGNRDLLRRPYNQTLLAGLRATHIPEVTLVRRLIEHHNAGLEQERLLLEAERT